MELTMMEQKLIAVEGRVGELEKNHAVLRVVIGGEDMTGKPGVLQNMLALMETVYKAPEGIVPRLTAMERRELERMSWVKGAWFIFSLLTGIIGYLLAKYVIK